MTNETSHHRQGDADPARDSRRAAAKRIDRVNEWLCLGGALPPEEYARFRDAMITHVVDLREDNAADAARLQQLGVAWRHVPVPNHGPPGFDQLADVARWLDGEGGKACLYVHCQGGFGRAATMAAGLLLARGSSLTDALRQLREARPEIQINEDQLAWLRGVEDRLAAAGRRNRSV